MRDTGDNSRISKSAVVALAPTPLYAPHNDAAKSHSKLPAYAVVVLLVASFAFISFVGGLDGFFLCLWVVHFLAVSPIFVYIANRVRHNIKLKPALLPEAVPHLPSEDADLPIYTILVPVYKEANMLAQMAKGLRELDYLANKLDIIILLEKDDAATQAKANNINWPPDTRIMIVPDGVPRTKPRACNYGLKHATGAFLVIYDAEDIPHAQQLRVALACFKAGGAKLACLQSPLSILLVHQGWLESQFLLEYRQLFRIILPALCQFNMPIPLGGTSNHFRTAILRKIGGWDAWNLTEDADIGLRLALEDYAIDMIEAPTFENAPHNLWIWLRQRTRWLSGHLQTLGTHGALSHQWLAKRGALPTVMAISILLARLLGGVLLAFCCVLMAALALNVWPLHILPQHIWDTPVSVIFLCIGVGIYAVIFIINFRLLADFAMRRRLFITATTPFYWMLTYPPFMIACWRILTNNLSWLKTPHKPQQK